MAKMHTIKGANSDHSIIKLWQWIQVKMYLHYGRKCTMKWLES